VEDNAPLGGSCMSDAYRFGMPGWLLVGRCGGLRPGKRFLYFFLLLILFLFFYFVVLNSNLIFNSILQELKVRTSYKYNSYITSTICCIRKISRGIAHNSFLDVVMVFVRGLSRNDF
jgi:hypothetical protein